MASLKFRIIIENGKAKKSVADIEGKIDNLKIKTETPSNIKIDAQGALATIRDVMLNLQSLKSIVGGVVNKANEFLNSSLKQKQAVTLVNIAFKEQSSEIRKLASGIQSVTNHGDEELLPLMAKLRQTYKLTTDEVKRLSPLLVDFADANASTGMTISSAFDLMGRALNGNTAMLGRYGIELDKTKLAQEGVSYLVKKLSDDYGGVSTALADLRLQNKNAWGDIKEQIGDMLNILITPLLKGIKSLFSWYNKLNPTVKGFVTGLAIAIPVIGTVSSAITILTTAIIALKSAINPVVGVISLIVGGLTAAGFAFASSANHTNQAENALARYKKQAQETKAKMDDLIANLIDFNELVSISRKEINSLSYEEAKRQFEEIGESIKRARKKYNDAIKSGDDDSAWKAFEEERNLMAKQTALRKRLFEDDLKAIDEYHSGKLRIEKENTYKGIRLLRFRIENAKKEYEAIKEINGATIQDKLSAYQKWQTLEKQLSDAIQSETDKRIEIQKQYSVLSIDNALSRRIAQLNLEKEAELKRAENLKAGEETLKNIRIYYANEEKRIRADFQRQKETEEEQKKEKLRQNEQELNAIREEFYSKSSEYTIKTYESELSAIESYYERKKNKLLEAGFTEEQITKQIEQAKNKIRETYNQKATQGFSTMFSNIAKSAQAFGKKGFAVWKAMSMAQALVDTYSSATAAYKAMVGLPVIGPGLAVVAAASAMAAGLANVNMISKQKYKEAALGGLMKGPSHSQGGFLINMEGDEYITRKSRVKELGSKFFDFINYAPLSDVKRVIGNALIPNIPMYSTTSFSYAGGGQVTENSAFITLIKKVDELISENKLLRKTLKDKKMTVYNQISPNEIIENADAIIINQKNEEGIRIRSEF